MRKIVLFMLGMLLISAQLLAQNRTITGKVMDDKGNAVANASVVVKGTSIGTTTATDGNFSLSVPLNVRTLVISYIGMGEKEIDLTASNSYNITLSATNKTDMQEIVVVAYGKQKRADITGSVATIGGADLENKPFTSIDKGLQGGVAGLQSVASSGAPGSNQQIRIRGISSVSANNNPLWVIDGVPVNTNDASRLTTSANLLSTLNPNDIESITVLKDAASASVYGSRAANGVILVTTKKGRSGKTKLRFDAEAGQSDQAYENEKYVPLNASEYFTITREGLVNLGVANPDPTLTSLGFGNGNDYNWYEAIRRRGQQKQYNLSASGGNEKTTFYASGGFFGQQGSIINTNLNRYNGTLSLTNKATDRLTIAADISGGFVRQRTPLAGGAFGNPILNSFFVLPSRNAYNADGTYNFSVGGLHNTVALSTLDIRRLKELGLRGAVSGTYKIIEGLNIKSQFGMDYNSLEEDQYNNPFHGDGASSNGRAYSAYTRISNWVWTNTADFSHNITRNGDANFDITVGYEAQSSRTYQNTAQAQNFPQNTKLIAVSVGSNPITAAERLDEYTFASAFSHAQVGFLDKFIVSGSFRRDGSSRFGSSNRYGNFWAVGATYNMDKEEFIKRIDFIYQLKLRASYGVNGNAGIGNYDWLTSYGYGVNYNQQPGSAPNNIGDTLLTWELNKPLNIGIDLGFLNGRINLTADWYKRKSEDLLLNVPLSRTTGFTSRTLNIGAMENKGIELKLDATPVKTKSFSWDIDFNFAHNINKVTSLPGGLDIPNGSFQIRVGYDIQSYYLRQYAGVDPANGDPLWYVDSSRKLTTNNIGAAQRVIVGSASPKYFGGLTNTFNYKGFTLEAQFNYNYGNYVQDPWGGYYVGAGFGATFNKVRRVLDRWQKPGDITDIPKYIYNGNKNFQNGSTFYLAKGDYIRLRNIQLGYRVPSSLLNKIKISNAFVYVRGTNLWTWVKDDNLPFDPEQGVSSQSNLDVFIPKTMTVGINLGF